MTIYSTSGQENLTPGSECCSQGESQTPQCATSPHREAGPGWWKRAASPHPTRWQHAAHRAGMGTLPPSSWGHGQQAAQPSPADQGLPQCWCTTRAFLTTQWDRDRQNQRPSTVTGQKFPVMWHKLSSVTLMKKAFHLRYFSRFAVEAGKHSMQTDKQKSWQT